MGNTHTPISVSSQMLNTWFHSFFHFLKLHFICCVYVWRCTYHSELKTPANKLLRIVPFYFQIVTEDTLCEDYPDCTSTVPLARQANSYYHSSQYVSSQMAAPILNSSSVNCLKEQRKRSHILPHQETHKN